MSITSRAVYTFVALAIATTVGGNLTAQASPNPNSYTRGNSGKVKEARNEKKDGNNKPSKSLEAQKTACTKVRASIANRTANLQSTGERHMLVIDKVYANLTEFTGREDVRLSQEQMSKIAEARSQAEQAIFSLGQNEDRLNCEDKNVGQMAAGIRLSVQKVNDSLKDYRNAVGDAIKDARAQLSTKGGA